MMIRTYGGVGIISTVQELGNDQMYVPPVDRRNEALRKAASLFRQMGCELAAVECERAIR